MFFYLLSIFCGFCVKGYRERKEAMKKGESENYREHMETKWKSGIDNRCEELVTTIGGKKGIWVYSKERTV